jgi:hypothetical protein
MNGMGFGLGVAKYGLTLFVLKITNYQMTTQYLTMGCEHKQKREEKIW